jgi:hypothetical protein
MGIIEQINNMQAQGIPENQIIANLQEQGISPREINEAINQIQIKNAVSSDQNPPQPEYSSQEAEYSNEQGEVPQQEDYQGNQGYSPGGETETIVEIAEQVFIDKVQSIQKKIDLVSEFKTLSEVKIANLDERLSRIESIIDKLQISILEKVGSYGKSLENTKKEMEMMQDSFRKVINKKR